MNSFLHNKLHSIFLHTLKSPNVSYMLAFSVNCNLAVEIMNLLGTKSKNNYVNSTKTFNKSYVSIIVSLANTLISTGKKNAAVKKYLADTPGWNEFFQQILEPINLKENSGLGKKENYIKDNLEKTEQDFEEYLESKGEDIESIPEINPSEPAPLQDAPEIFASEEITIEKIQIEPPLQSEFASNNYWRPASYFPSEILNLENPLPTDSVQLVGHFLQEFATSNYWKFEVNLLDISHLDYY